MRTVLAFSLTCLLATNLLLPAMAEVYKRVNPDGSVEFTDVPSSKEEQPVTLPPPSTYQAPAPVMPQPKTAPQVSASKYTALSIVSPANDATLRDNAGNIEVKVSLSPALQAGHKLVLLVDGSSQGETTDNTFALTNLERGSHQLTAEVRDAKGETLISSASVTVFLHRHSILFKRNPPPHSGKTIP